MSPTRPLMRYHGGKWQLAPFVLAHLPPHRRYVEPFGGAASILLLKPRAHAEIYNDLDGDLVALFRLMRDPEQAATLVTQLELTPYAREEFDLSYQSTDDPLERARRLLVRSWMGHGSSGLRAHRTGFRLGKCENTGPPTNWRNFPGALPAIVDRLRGVAIECRPAAEIIARHDGEDVLFYLDPPYPFGVRSQKRRRGDLYHGYRHELDDEGHRALLAQIVALRGMVVLSGYPSALYDDALSGWERAETSAYADGRSARTEVLWINPLAAVRLREAACERISPHVSTQMALTLEASALSVAAE